MRIRGVFLGSLGVLLAISFGVSYAAEPATGGVVINEVAWGGTRANVSDQWIELYNTTDSQVVVEGWWLVARPQGPQIEITGCKDGPCVIPPEGYFLLENPDDNTIVDVEADLTYRGTFAPDTTLRLWDGKPGNNDQSQLIDSANAAGSGWPGGDRRTRRTIERLDPLKGDTTDNWGTFCPETLVPDPKYARGLEIFGTPRAQNSIRPAEANFVFAPSIPEINSGVQFSPRQGNCVIVRYEWDLDGDGIVDHVYRVNEDPKDNLKQSRLYPVAGSYTITLWVTDTWGDRFSQQKTLTVYASPRAGFQVLFPSYPPVRDVVQFVSTSFDPDGEVASCEWDFDVARKAGLPDAQRQSTSCTPQPVTYNNPNVGEVEVTLTVKDNDGFSDTTRHSFTFPVRVNYPPRPDFIALFSQYPPVRNVVQFVNHSIDPDGTIDGCQWDFAADEDSKQYLPEAERTSDQCSPPPVSYRGNPESVTVTLSVTDDKGSVKAITKEVTFPAGVPPPSVLSCSINTRIKGLEVEFSATCTDKNGDPVRPDVWLWDFGDGTQSRSWPPPRLWPPWFPMPPWPPPRPWPPWPLSPWPTVTHTYREGGSYRVTLTLRVGYERVVSQVEVNLPSDCPLVASSLPKRDLILLVDLSGSMDMAQLRPLLEETIDQLDCWLNPSSLVELVTYNSTPSFAPYPTLHLAPWTWQRTAIRSWLKHPIKTESTSDLRSALSGAATHLALSGRPEVPDSIVLITRGPTLPGIWDPQMVGAWLRGMDVSFTAVGMSNFIFRREGYKDIQTIARATGRDLIYYDEREPSMIPEVAFCAVLEGVYGFSCPPRYFFLHPTSRSLDENKIVLLQALANPDLLSELASNVDAEIKAFVQDLENRTGKTSDELIQLGKESPLELLRVLVEAYRSQDVGGTVCQVGGVLLQLGKVRSPTMSFQNALLSGVKALWDEGCQRGVVQDFVGWVTRIVQCVIQGVKEGDWSCLSGLLETHL